MHKPKQLIIRFYLAIPKKVARFICVVLFLSFVLYGIFLSAPSNFPENDMVVIPKDSTVVVAGNLLKTRHIIRSTTLFAIVVKLSGENGVIAGGYLFNHKENLLKVGVRLAKGDHELTSIRVTFPEGLTVKELANLCAKNLPLCNEQQFIALGTPFEGYLFPDTYFFLQSADAKEVVQTMHDTFKDKEQPLDREIKNFGKSMSDVVIMASILEREAQNFENRVNVASILWKRIAIGMPLQVDSSLDYALNKNTYELSSVDLATSSPYNTYKYKGLPPTPIANPGLESIRAALSAKPTKYLYYLTSRGGTFYYATTFEEHVANKHRYLNATK